MSDKKIVFNTPWFRVEEEEYPSEGMTGKNPFYRIITSPGVMIIPFTPEGKIIAVRQFRPALDEITTEFPSGYKEEGETPESAMKRELYEETGYRCEKIIPLSEKLEMVPSRISSELAVFWGTNAVKDANFSPKEHIKTVLISPEELKESALKGDFNQMSGLSIFFLWLLKTGRDL